MSCTKLCCTRRKTPPPTPMSYTTSAVDIYELFRRYREKPIEHPSEVENTLERRLLTFYPRGVSELRLFNEQRTYSRRVIHLAVSRLIQRHRIHRDADGVLHAAAHRL